MPSFELEESEYHGPIPEDSIILAELLGCKIAEKPYYEDDGVTKVRKVEFKFKVIDDRPDFEKWNGTFIWGETPVRFNTHPECKLKNWAQALDGGIEYPAGYRLDTDILAGKQARIVVGYRTYKDKNGEEKERNFVQDVMPVRQTAGASAF